MPRIYFDKVSGTILCENYLPMNKRCDECQRGNENDCKSMKPFYHFEVSLHYGKGNAISICNYGRRFYMLHGLGGGEPEY